MYVFDHVVIAVAEPAGAGELYARLLGREGIDGRFVLANADLRLVAPQVDGRIARHLAERGEGLFSLGFIVDDPAESASVPDFAVPIEVSLQAERRRIDVAPDVVHALDHVVVRSCDGDRAINFYGNRLGLRLALDREQFGSRMIFFRSAGVTVEVVVPLEGEVDPVDRIWGLAYRVSDAVAAHTRMERAGFDLSGLRGGRKPGTRVFSVRSQTCGVPTLVIAED